MPGKVRTHPDRADSGRTQPKEMPLSESSKEHGVSPDEVLPPAPDGFLPPVDDDVTGQETPGSDPS
ncbi:MAG: hypothetical protein ACE5ID_09330, partial [Acidobacteriota bacterium]